MKPDVTSVALDFSARLANDLAPNLSGFEAVNASMIAASLAMIAEEWDRAANRLVEENRAIRAILEKAAELFDDDNLRQLKGQLEPDFRISTLEAHNDRLRDALISVHEKTEQSGDLQAKALETSIWHELRLSVERRKLSSANF
ncbi:MAG: hypothetical protein AB7U63_03810 [Porticoccaceae bacterium]